MKDIEDIIQVDDIGYVRKGDRAILRWILWTLVIELEAASRDVRKLGYDGAQGLPSLILIHHWAQSVTYSDYSND